MKAIVQKSYGPPEILDLEEHAAPTLTDDRVLIRVHAAGVNPYDWHMLTGKPYLVRLMGGLRFPKRKVPGVDVSGTVEAVGAAVTRFSPGDEVWGTCGGAYAEYARALERMLVPKPPNVSFEQAGSVAIAAITALQAVRDGGEVGPGDRVLINGASGGVGTFAVQIAKARGAHVTGVCSTRNLDMVRSIGADETVDYTTTDYTRTGQRYDVIVDMIANHSTRANRRAMVDDGILVKVGDEKVGDWVGPVISYIGLGQRLGWPGRRQKVRSVLGKIHQTDLEVLNEMLASGAVTPAVGHRFSLEDTRAALRFQGDGHAQGKTVIVVRP